jgi:hypothetical protein
MQQRDVPLLSLQTFSLPSFWACLPHSIISPQFVGHSEIAVIAKIRGIVRDGFTFSNGCFAFLSRNGRPLPCLVITSTNTEENPAAPTSRSTRIATDAKSICMWPQVDVRPRLQLAPSLRHCYICCRAGLQISWGLSSHWETQPRPSLGYGPMQPRCWKRRQNLSKKQNLDRNRDLKRMNKKRKSYTQI